MMRIFSVITFVTAILFLSGIASGDDSRKLRENKQELHSIKTQLEEARQKVDSLKQLEKNLQKGIAKYGERVSRNRKLVGRMESELESVRAELSNNGRLLDDTAERLQRKRAACADLLLDYYRKRNSREDINPWNFDSHLSRSRRVHYLSAISGRTTHEIVQVGNSVSLLTQSIDSLEREGSDLKRLRKEKKARIDLDLTLRDKEETSLGTVRRQTNLMRDRLVSLSAVARQMEEIIAELEKAQRQRRKTEGPRPRFHSGPFTQFKGTLTPPIQGKIVKSFGWKTDRITGLKSFSPGIDINPLKDRQYIVACAPGRVAYVGSLRGYESFVILEHDDGYYTTYAGLSHGIVEQDDLINAGERLGLRGSGNIHFELRRGREHLDPVIWLDIDEF